MWVDLPVLRPGESKFYHITKGFDDWLLLKRELALAEFLTTDATALRDVILDNIPAKSPLEHVNESDFAFSSERFASNHSVTDLIRTLEQWTAPTMQVSSSLSLDASQRLAIATFLKSPISVIQGPPGTGKTNTIVAALWLLKNECAFEGPISVNAHTHDAIESLARRCLETGLNIVILGKLSKLSEGSALEEHTLAGHLKRHQWWPILCAFQTELTRLLEAANVHEAELAEFRDKKKKFPGRGRTYRKQIDLLQAELRAIKSDLLVVRQHFKRLRAVMCHDIISGADVCLATCLGFGGRVTSTIDFPLVLVDEATQCDLPESLMPFLKQARQVCLVGDHKQLEPIVCAEAKKEKLDISMFEYLINGKGVPAAMLTTQHRMLSAISEFPNKHFYDGKLQDSAERQSAGQQLDDQDVISSLAHAHPEMSMQRGKFNPAEAELAVEVAQRLVNEGIASGRTEQEALGEIGIVTPYRLQALHVRRLVGEKFGDGNHLEVATVNAFQGREKSNIILSLVRSNNNTYSSSQALGFIVDRRRACVALTRARERLFVMGNAETISRYPNVWSDLLKE